MDTPMFRLFPAVLLAIAISLPTALAGPNVPFKASLSTRELVFFGPPSAPPPPLQGYCAAIDSRFFAGTGAITVVGTASLLGRVTGGGTDCISYVTFGPPPSFRFDNGKLTLRAANGDEVHAEYFGRFTPTDPSQPSTIYAIEGTFVVKGGTGRFASAMGQGVLGGTENITTFQGLLELSGTISY